MLNQYDTLFFRRRFLQRQNAACSRSEYATLLLSYTWLISVSMYMLGYEHSAKIALLLAMIATVSNGIKYSMFGFRKIPQ